MTNNIKIDEKALAAYNPELDESEFEGNYNFIVSKNEAGEFFAHRPIEPAFFIFRNTEEAAVTAATDIITDYITLFSLTSEKIESPHRADTIGQAVPSYYTVAPKKLVAA